MNECDRILNSNPEDYGINDRRVECQDPVATAPGSVSGVVPLIICSGFANFTSMQLQVSKLNSFLRADPRLKRVLHFRHLCHQIRSVD